MYLWQGISFCECEECCQSAGCFVDACLAVDKPCVDREGRGCSNLFCSHPYIFMREGAGWLPVDAVSIYPSGFGRYVNGSQVLGKFYLLEYYALSP